VDKYKILHSGSVTANASSTVSASYTVPVAASTTVGAVEVAPQSVSAVTQALVTRIFVCNTHATNNGTFDIKVSDYGSGPTVTKLYSAISLYPGITSAFGVNLTLKAGDIVTVEFAIDASPATYDVTIFGIEMITGSGPDA
jgi:hypothetical protein